MVKRDDVTYAAWLAIHNHVDNKCWRAFEDFLVDMGPCPEGGRLKRRDKTCAFTTTNCYWHARKSRKRSSLSPAKPRAPRRAYEPTTVSRCRERAAGVRAMHGGALDSRTLETKLAQVLAQGEGGPRPG